MGCSPMERTEKTLWKKKKLSICNITLIVSTGIFQLISPGSHKHQFDDGNVSATYNHLKPKAQLLHTSYYRLFKEQNVCLSCVFYGVFLGSYEASSFNNMYIYLLYYLMYILWTYLYLLYTMSYGIKKGNKVKPLSSKNVKRM